MTERFELNSVQKDELEQPFAPTSELRQIEGEIAETHERCSLLDAAHERNLTAKEVSLFHLAMRGYLQFTEKAKHPPRNLGRR
jgi:hypothetical protein